ncbi:hypothetical protein G6F65_019399 [Rhizopus arrhizus]|nr:hypothetical protein G6F65_019399 [Rhizopus arrhizus]
MHGVQTCHGRHRLTRSRGLSVLVIAADQVYPFAQFLARLEVRHLFARHQHLFAGFRIATDSGRPLRQREAAKTADLDALTRGQGLGHCIQHGLDRVIGVAGGQLRIAGRQGGDQLRLGHELTVVALLVQLGLQQRAEVGGAGRSAGVGHALDRVGGLGVVTGLDRQLDRTRLAVDVDDHGFDVFASVQNGGGIFNAARGDLGSAQVAFNVHGQPA